MAVASPSGNTWLTARAHLLSSLKAYPSVWILALAPLLFLLLPFGEMPALVGFFYLFGCLCFLIMIGSRSFLSWFLIQPALRRAKRQGLILARARRVRGKPTEHAAMRTVVAMVIFSFLVGRIFLLLAPSIWPQYEAQIVGGAGTVVGTILVGLIAPAFWAVHVLRVRFVDLKTGQNDALQIGFGLQKVGPFAALFAFLALAIFPATHPLMDRIALGLAQAIITIPGTFGPVAVATLLYLAFRAKADLAWVENQLPIQETETFWEHAPATMPESHPQPDDGS